MCCAPRLDPGNRFGASVIVLILWFGEPFRLAGTLAGKPARCCRAIAMMPFVTGFRRKDRPAMHTLASFRLRHFVLLAGNRSRHRLNTRRRPKKTPNNEKNLIRYMTNSKARKSNFTPAENSRFQVGRDNHRQLRFFPEELTCFASILRTAFIRIAGLNDRNHAAIDLRYQCQLTSGGANTGGHVLFVQTTGVTFGDGGRRAVRDVNAVMLENLLANLGKGEVSAEIGDGPL